MAPGFRKKASSPPATSALASTARLVASKLFTSAAQMFDERGRGFHSQRKRRTNRELGKGILTSRKTMQSLWLSIRSNRSRLHHMNYPARVIVLKTSKFRDEEADGIFEALDEVGTELRDLVWVQELSFVKVFRRWQLPCYARHVRGTRW